MTHLNPSHPIRPPSTSNSGNWLNPRGTLITRQRYSDNTCLERMRVAALMKTLKSVR